MSFGARHLLWLMLLSPAAVLLAYWFWQRRMAAVAAWAAPGLWDRLRLHFVPRRLVASSVLLLLTLLGVAVALAQPRWGEIEQTVEREGVDIVFVVDSSLSMAAPDVPPSRMEASRSLVRRLVAGLPGHRVALVQAEGEGVVLAPLTVDAAVIDLLLDTVDPGSLPSPGTKLAAASKVALELFPQESEKHRILILLTDGEDHGGQLDTLIDDIQEAGVVVHALGIGTTKGSPLPLPGGGPNRYKQDNEGRVVISRLHEEPLIELTGETGGVYLHVDSAAADPAPVIAAIDEMQRRSFEGEVLEVQAERFQWPVGLAVLCLAALLLWTPFRRHRELAG